MSWISLAIVLGVPPRLTTPMTRWWSSWVTRQSLRVLRRGGRPAAEHRVDDAVGEVGQNGRYRLAVGGGVFGGVHQVSGRKLATMAR